MLILGFVAALVIASLWPDIPAGKFLHRLLIETPARKLNKFSPTTLCVLLVSVLAGAALVAAWQSDGLALALPGAEALAYFAAFDVGSYLELTAVVWLLAANVHLKGTWRAARSAIVAVRRQMRPRPRRVAARRAPRRPAASRSRCADNDDEPAVALAA
jgi:hypothetical protein